MTAPTTCPPSSRKVSAPWRKLFALYLKLTGYDCLRDAAGFWFDEAAAEAVILFFETRLCHTEGAPSLVGTPIILEPWQKAFLGIFYGWMRADGTRRYRDDFLYVPRKNGKTTMQAGRSLYHLYCEDEGAQQIYSAAADKRQAKIAHKMAKRMIAREPELADLATVYADAITVEDHVYNIVTEGFTGQHGMNVSAAFIDEVHEHRGRDLSDAITTSQGARRQPVASYATTAAEVGENFCNELYDYYTAVRDGRIFAPHSLPCIFEAGIDDNWRLEKTWRKANPNLGVTVPLSFYQEECEKAKRIPSYQNTFRRLYLNQRTQSLTVWIDITDWDKCSGLKAGETPGEWRERALEALVGQACYGGIDLGSVSDLTAFALLFDGAAMGYDDCLVAIPWCWCPEKALANKSEQNRGIYQLWIDDEFLRTTDGNATDFAAVRADMANIVKPFNLIDCGMDMYQGAETAQYLQDHEGFKIIGYPQGFSGMANPTQEFERRVMAGTIRHGGNPILRWMVGHCMVKEHNALKRPVKPESKNSAKKIDAVVAVLMAMGRYLVRPQQEAGELFFV